MSDADISNQIRVLNNGFSGQEGGYPTGFTFVLAGVVLFQEDARRKATTSTTRRPG